MVPSAHSGPQYAAGCFPRSEMKETKGNEGTEWLTHAGTRAGQPSAAGATTSEALHLPEAGSEQPSLRTANEWLLAGGAVTGS